jgi:hypothetical protein
MLYAFGQTILGIEQDKKIRFLEHEKDSIRNERNNAVLNVDNDDKLCDNLVRLLVD